MFSRFLKDLSGIGITNRSSLSNLFLHEWLRISDDVSINDLFSPFVFHFGQTTPSSTWDDESHLIRRLIAKSTVLFCSSFLSHGNLESFFVVIVFVGIVSREMIRDGSLYRIDDHVGFLV